MNPARRGHQIQASASRKRVAALAAVAVLAAVLGLSAPAAGQGTISDALRQKYSWCFERMSEQACAAAIARWETEAWRLQAPWLGTHMGVDTYDDCSLTHSIRIRRSVGHGVLCQQSFHPVGPFGGVIAPPSRLEDGWDGSARGCHPNSHGYYNLPADRTDSTHGLGHGCHTHNGGSNFHEHD